MRKSMGGMIACVVSFGLESDRARSDSEKESHKDFSACRRMNKTHSP